MKKFAVFDIDGTLIRWQLFHAVTSAMLQQSSNSEIYDRIKQARMAWKKRDDSDSFRQYEQTLIKAYDEIITSLNAAEFDHAVEAIFDEYKDQVYTYTRDLVSRLKEDGYFLIAISGSQQELVSKIADYYGFDAFVGTVFARKGDKFTGEKTVASKDKQAILRRLIKKYGLSVENSIAVGDSESDIPMLEHVKNPVAFNPTKKLYEHARLAGWPIVVERKNNIYQLRAVNGSYVLA